MASKMIDLTGNKYGRLTVIAFVSVRLPHMTMWLCECECGIRKILSRRTLRGGNSKSCGCYRDEKTAAVGRAQRRHGLWRSAEYRSWGAMLQRCSNPKYPWYHRYGGRGVHVCAEWHAFEKFYQDMGPRPGSEYSLERIDNDKGYEPSNCKWATKKEQSDNRYNTHRFTFNGQTKTLAEWAETLGIKRETLYTRLITRGWSIEKALTKPTQQRRPSVA